MMLVDKIRFIGHNSQVIVEVDGGSDNRFSIIIDANQQLRATIDQLRALQSALTRVLEGR